MTKRLTEVPLLLLPLIGSLWGDTPNRLPTSQDFETAFHSIASHIKNTFPHCSHLIQVFESHSDFLKAAAKALQLLQDMDATNQPGGLIIDLSPTANSGDPYIRFFIENRYFFKYHQPCSVVFYELNSPLLDNAEHLNNATFGRRWPERALPLLPNNVQTSFFVFFSSHASNDPRTYKSRVNDFMHQTGMILHAVFLIPQDTGEIKVLKGIPKNSKGNLDSVATYDGDSFKAVPGKSLFYRMYTNFHGDPLITVDCMVCKSDDELYKRTGLGRTGFHVAWYIIHEKFNMTRASEEIFGVPGMGVKLDKDEDGNEIWEYDEFLLPLIEDAAAISVFVITNPYVQEVVWLTRPYIYDAMCFLTGPAKVHKMESAAVLQEPLENQVWCALTVSFFALVLSLHLLTAYKGDESTFLKVVAAVIRPILDQSIIIGRWIGSCRVQILIAMWLLAMIVLGSAYKSKLLSAIVVRRYDYPPRTFEELARSDYVIGAIFFQSVEHDLLAFNTSVNWELAGRIGELDFMLPDCYKMIFEGRKACIGYMLTFDLIGSKFLVDVKGRPMFLRSKDSHFNGQVMAAVSKFYPMLLEPIEYFISNIDQSGISEFLRMHETAKSMKEGRENAKRNVETLKYYKGVDTGEDFCNDKVVGVVLEILKFGFALASFVFVVEKLSPVILNAVHVSRLSRKRNKEFHQWDISWTKPLLYGNEFYIQVQTAIR